MRRRGCGAPSPRCRRRAEPDGSDRAAPACSDSTPVGRGWLRGRLRRARSCRVHAPSELLDLSLCGVELSQTDPVELLTTLPEGKRLVEARLAALEAVDDLLQLPLGRLERRRLRGHGPVSSTRAPNLPAASRTSTRSPALR